MRARFVLLKFVLPLLLLAACCRLHAEDNPKELSLDLGKGVKLDLVLISAGTFEMGTPETEVGRKKSETKHTVVLTKPFYMGKYEVTQEQYEAVTTENPSRNKGPTLPVEHMLFDEAAKFCEKLGEKTGKLVQLPTEAQWEYACRAGTRTAYNTGDTITPADANFNGDVKPAISAVSDVKPASTVTTTDTKPVTNAANTDVKPAIGAVSADVKPAVNSVNNDNRDKTLPVGSFKPNAWGLYDMHGNVLEWCRDWYDENYYTATSTTPAAPAPVQDPEGPAKSSEDPPAHVLRGGSYYSLAAEVRSGVRDSLGAPWRNAHAGFRVIIQIDK